MSCVRALARAAVDNGLSRNAVRARNAVRGAITLDAAAASRSTVALFDQQLG